MNDDGDGGGGAGMMHRATARCIKNLGRNNSGLPLVPGRASLLFVHFRNGRISRSLRGEHLVNSSKLADTFLSLSRRLVNASSAEGRKVKFLSAANLNGMMIDEKK